MSVIKPFRALRPAPEQAEHVSCMPYDVVHDSEVREFIQENPQNFLRVTRAEAEYPSTYIPAVGEVFEKAAANLHELVDRGVLSEELEPSFYVYRLTTGSHQQTGVVACCSLDEYEQGLIKKHEKTRPDKVEDRKEHMLAVRAQTGLIFLAYRGTERISDIVRETTATEPLYDFTGTSEIRHTVWRVRSTDELAEAFAEVPSLYIADGHHRIESALRSRAVLRETNPCHTGEEDYNYVLAGIFPAEDLQILAYNRVVHDLNGLSDEEFLAKVQENFILQENGQKTPEHHGQICLYLSGKWYTLEFAVNYFRQPDPIERLDVSILQNFILAPILGITDIQRDTRIAFIGGIRGSSELERLVDSGEARVAFALFPTTMDDLFEVSDRGEIMPPKSTWFEPKLKDGLFVHTI